MIDTFLRLVDKAIELLRTRKEAGRELLAQVIEPLFSEMTFVVDDYTSLFLEAIQAIDESIEDPITSAVHKIKARRQQLLSTRIKVREMAHVIANEFRSKELTEFAEAILAFFHSSQIVPFKSNSTPARNLLVELHDVLDNPSLDKNAAKANIEHALSNIEANWVQVTRSYSKLKLHLSK